MKLLSSRLPALFALLILVAPLLAACGLVVGTVDYALLVRRRAALRRRWREVAAAQEAGLHGLVRVLLIDR